MKVLVYGHAGWIGGQFVELLGKNNIDQPPSFVVHWFRAFFHPVGYGKKFDWDRLVEELT